MPGVFISYRRDDCPGDVRRVYDALVASLAPEFVFLDISGIEAAERFEDVIKERLLRSDVVIVAIGPRWRTYFEELAQPGRIDYVQNEIRLALESRKVVIPLLFRNARIPDPAGVPEAIRDVTTLHAHSINDRHFEADVASLVRMVRRHFWIPRSRFRQALLLYRSRTVRGLMLRALMLALGVFAAAELIGVPAALNQFGAIGRGRAAWGGAECCRRCVRSSPRGLALGNRVLAEPTSNLKVLWGSAAVNSKSSSFAGIGR